MESSLLPCFKAYDIRGKVPDELNSELAEKIGLCFADQFALKKVVVGRDIRLTGRELSAALISGLRAKGTDVVDLGLSGTEEIYFSAFNMEAEGVDGGIIVTASHNPSDYNGMKFVVKGARPVTGEGGLNEISRRIVRNDLPQPSARTGSVTLLNIKQSYIKHLLSYIEVDPLRPLTIVVNSGNGCAGPVVDLLEEQLPFRFIKHLHDPDGSFPNGVPNPLLPENRKETADLVRKYKADFGIGWDGDFDRCFFWDEKGRFVEGYYIVGLLAVQMLKKEPGSKILYDPRLTWNTKELVQEAGGVPIMTKTGHAFIKQRMRKEEAIYGGEMSAHHYFKDFGYCDSGMIPWLLVASLLSTGNKKFSELLGDCMTKYPVSGEINRQVEKPKQVIRTLEEAYIEGERDYTDGLSVAFDDYRFNVRMSNTEPLIRLNVETRGDTDLLREKTEELLQYIK